MSEQDKLELEKVAADPQKALAMLQGLRNEAETGGDLDGAALYTQAIALLLEASGEAEVKEEEAPEGEPETSESAPESGAEAPEEELMLAATPTLRKAGRTFSGGNSQAMHSVIQAIAQMLSKAGDPVAEAILKCYGPKSDEENPKEEKAVQAGDLQKIVQESLAKVEALNKLDAALEGFQKLLEAQAQRIEQLERQPSEGGPVLRPVEKVIASGNAQRQEPEEAPVHKTTIAELQRMANVTPDPILKAEYNRQLWIAQRETVKKS